MFRNAKVLALALIGLGMLLGYAAATGPFNFFPHAEAALVSESAFTQPTLSKEPVSEPTSCCSGVNKSAALTMIKEHNSAVAAKAAQEGKKPNIMFIMGDDIGMWN